MSPSENCTLNIVPVSVCSKLITFPLNARNSFLTLNGVVTMCPTQVSAIWFGTVSPFSLFLLGRLPVGSGDAARPITRGCCLFREGLAGCPEGLRFRVLRVLRVLFLVDCSDSESDSGSMLLVSSRCLCPLCLSLSSSMSPPICLRRWNLALSVKYENSE